MPNPKLNPFDSLMASCDFQQIRRYLHAHPETAYQETQTAAWVATFLKKCGLKVIENIGKTGVVALLQHQKNKPFVALRADMDALPIEEANCFDYRSQTKGNMHACGHDGHMAMLLQAAFILSQDETFQGNVAFVFQPAEEGGAGAQKMIEEGLFRLFPCCAIFALHNWPGLAAGKIAVFPGPIMAGNCHIAFDFIGKGCHAALPFEGDDVILAASTFITTLQAFVQRQKSAQSPIVLSITQFHAGDAFNVLPSSAKLCGTLRYFDSTLLEQNLLPHIRQIANGIAQTFGITIQSHLTPHYPPTLNDESAALFAQKIAEKIAGKENVIRHAQPAMTSEDFAFMLQEKPGAYAWIGNGSSFPLHNPSYDFNDEILALGARYFVELAKSAQDFNSSIVQPA